MSDLLYFCLSVFVRVHLEFVCAFLNVCVCGLLCLLSLYLYVRRVTVSRVSNMCCIVLVYAWYVCGTRVVFVKCLLDMFADIKYFCDALQSVQIICSDSFCKCLVSVWYVFGLSLVCGLCLSAMVFCVLL